MEDHLIPDPDWASTSIKAVSLRLLGELNEIDDPGKMLSTCPQLALAIYIAGHAAPPGSLGLSVVCREPSTGWWTLACIVLHPKETDCSISTCMALALHGANAICCAWHVFPNLSVAFWFLLPGLTQAAPALKSPLTHPARASHHWIPIALIWDDWSSNSVFSHQFASQVSTSDLRLVVRSLEAGIVPDFPLFSAWIRIVPHNLRASVIIDSGAVFQLMLFCWCLPLC